jgi:predicted SAM-dependent methyltransferase
MTPIHNHARALGKRLIPSQGLRVELRELQTVAKRVAGLAFTRARTRGRRLSDVRGEQLLINFGAGSLQDSAWINVDIEPQENAYFADLRDPLPLRDGCAAHIHCEHFLEHLSYHYAKLFLAECCRALQPGAIMRIIVPDAGKYLRAYAAGDRTFFESLSDLGNPAQPFRTPIEIINQMFRMAGAHMFAWDLETLRLAVEEAGFASLELSQRGAMQGRYDVDGHEWWREAESLYCNARKG